MNKTNKTGSFITVIELAKRLGVTRGAIYKKINSGHIQAEKIGNHYFISTNEFEGIVTKELSDKIKIEIEHGVAKVVKEYGKTLRLLGKE